jgi:hypothetical protein
MAHGGSFPALDPHTFPASAFLAGIAPESAGFFRQAVAKTAE